MKIIKKYLQFINETKSTKVEVLSKDELFDKVWKLKEQELKDYFLPLKDFGYSMTIYRGFFGEDFTNDIKSGDDLYPAYQIIIGMTSNLTSKDLTDDFLQINNFLMQDYNLQVSDGHGKLKIEDIRLQGSITYVDNGEEYDIDSRYLYLNIWDKEQVEISPRLVVDYYEWDCDDKSNYDAYVVVEKNDLIDNLLSKEDSKQYGKMLKNGEEEMDHYYYNNEYVPDFDSVFNYTLNKENEILALKSIIKELGGLDEFKNIYDEFKDIQSEVDISEYFDNNKDRYYKNKFLSKISKDSEIMSEVRTTIRDWEISAHISKNYDELWESFIKDIVDKKIVDYSTYKSDIEKYYWVGEGESRVKKTYTEETTFFSFPLQNEWFDNLDGDDKLKFKHLHDVWYEFICNDGYEKMRPYFSDYGNVDNKSLNEEIKSIFISYLKN
jgi:hypothetical protein